MSSNLLNGITPTLLNGVTKDGDVYTVPKKTNDSHHTDHLRYHLSIPKLGSNRKFHVGFSRKAVSTSTDGVLVGIAYKDDAGNYGYNYVMCDNSKEPWTWFSDSIRIPSGMTIDYLYIAAYRKTNEMRITNVTLSYDAPVALAMSEITATDVKDGKSPTVSVSKSGTVTTIVVTNADGSKTTQTVNDGVNGTPGTPGADGKTPYFHVKYSNDGGKTFTANSGETAGTYIGTCTDYNSADPTAVGSYTWAKIKGDTGTGVSAIVEQYYLSTSSTTQTGGSWSTTSPAWQSGHYIWTRSQITWTTGAITYTTPVLANGLNSANSEAKNATTIANGKNKVVFSATANPSGTSGYSAGDIWFNKSTGGIWQFDGAKWNPHQVGTTSIANGAITADKVAANAINAQKINVDTLSAISANLGDITAGDINGVTIKGSEFRTNWTMVDAHRGIFSRVRFTEEELLFDVWWDESDDSNSNAPEDADNPIMVYRLYYQNQSAGDNIYGLILKESFYGSDEGNRYRVLMEPIDAGDGVQIHSGSGKVAFDSGDSATPTKILNKNNFGEPINSIAIGSEKEHTISFGWTGSRLRPVIDGNQLYMPVIDTIFDNASNGMGSGASLTSPATNYDALDIFCKTDDGVQLYTKVCNPAVGTTFEVSVNHMSAGGGHMWMKTKQFIIDGESHISTAQSGANWYAGILRIDSNSTPTAVSVGDYITIIRVVGWKY